MIRPLLALVLAAAASPAFAQGSKGVVAVTAAGPAQPVAAGGSFQVTVTLQVKSGYHINAQKPTEDYLVGTLLTLTPPEGVAVSKIAYPSAEMATFEFSETPLAVYDGTVKIVATLKSAASLAPGRITVPGKVRFQACNDQACLPPSTVDVSATAEVAAATATEKATLTLSGAPPEARVLVDGRAVGKTDSAGRLVAKELEPGRRRVEVSLDGYALWQQHVTLDAAKPQMLTVALTAEAAPPPSAVATVPETAPAPTPSEPAPPPANIEDERGPGTLLVAGIGALVVALAAVAVFMRR
jgi:DsbC/DsbD-like thiol-disulfide interchange protein